MAVAGAENGAGATGGSPFSRAASENPSLPVQRTLKVSGRLCPGMNGASIDKRLGALPVKAEGIARLVVRDLFPAVEPVNWEAARKR